MHPTEFIIDSMAGLVKSGQITCRASFPRLMPGDRTIFNHVKKAVDFFTYCVKISRQSADSSFVPSCRKTKPGLHNGYIIRSLFAVLHFAGLFLFG